MDQNNKNWDREYRNPVFLSKSEKPRKDLVEFFRYLKKSGFEVEGKNFLDLGTGTGRNAFFMAQKGMKGVGIDVSQTAIDIAQKRLLTETYDIDFKVGDMGQKFQYPDNSFDIVVDILSSNSLDESGREMYVSETKRVLKTGGHMLIIALCKDGDQNAKELLKKFPGKEKDTYILAETGICERVFTKEDFINTYASNFKILELKKKTNYTRFNNKSYKRNFWIAYMQKI